MRADSDERGHALDLDAHLTNAGPARDERARDRDSSSSAWVISGTSAAPSWGPTNQASNCWKTSASWSVDVRELRFEWRSELMTVSERILSATAGVRRSPTSSALFARGSAAPALGWRGSPIRCPPAADPARVARSSPCSGRRSQPRRQQRRTGRRTGAGPAARRRRPQSDCCRDRH